MFILFPLAMLGLLAAALLNYHGNNNNRYKTFSILLIVVSIATMFQYYLVLFIGGGGPDYGQEFQQLYIPWIFCGMFVVVGLIYFFRKKK